MSDTFYICVCSPFGPTYQFLLQDAVVHYSFSTQHMVRETNRLPQLEHQPDPQAIKEFWESIFDLGIADWAPEYLNPEIPDGPSWEVRMEYNGAQYASHGTAAFPGNPHPAYSPEFIELIMTVRRLLNWMPFG